MRFLAEAAWYPTALLPSQGVRWETVDDRSARATLTDGSLSVTMLFAFAESGLIETVRAEARGRIVRGAFTRTPWEGRFWNYAERDGMRVPLEGEAAWLLAASIGLPLYLVDRRTGRPPPWLAAVPPRDGGLLLVAITHAVPDFVERLGPQVERSGLKVYDIGRRGYLYDTVLEVIDVERGVVVAMTVTDYAIFGFIPGTPLAFTHNEVDCVPEVVVVRITLDRDAG